MLFKRKVIEIMSSIRDDVKKFGVRKLWLFGSYVREEQKKISDIDILVKFEKGKKTFDNYMELKFFLEEKLGVKVDLIPAESLRPEIKDHVWKEAVSIEGL